MANNGGKGFLFATRLYKSPNDAAILDPKKWNPEGKVYVQLEGAATNKQEKTTIKQQETRKIHVNDLRTKLSHTGEDRMGATANHLQWIFKIMLEVYKYWATEKTKKKYIFKVKKEQDLKPGEII